MRVAKRAYGTEYCEYVLLCTNDCLMILDNAEAILRQEIGNHWDLKEESIRPPKIYLGGKIRKVALDTMEPRLGHLDLLGMLKQSSKMLQNT